jgi:hypothetical protein
MNISLKRIVEQYGAESQYYDLGKDFANFRRTSDGANEEIKKRFEKTIGSKLIGKRVKARASRGYKQYVKDYEFDVVKITLDDYYDNYVVVAHDNTTPKSKEYFLKPGFKIQILGSATGQPSPQKGGPPDQQLPNTNSKPPPEPSSAQHTPTNPSSTINTTSERPMEEEKSEGVYDAYPIEMIIRDVKEWLPLILVKPEANLRDFVKGLGWQKNLDHKTSVSLFDLRIPADFIKPNVNKKDVKELIDKSTKEDAKYEMVKIEPDNDKGQWNIRIKKTTANKNI